MTQRDRDRVLALAHGGGGIEFSGATVRQLSGPCVYVLLRGDTALYVGMSGRDAGRPFSIAHHALRKVAVLDTDSLLVWPVATRAEAIELERLLIKQLRPTANKACSLHIAEQVDISPARLGEIWRARAGA